MDLFRVITLKTFRKQYIFVLITLKTFEYD